MTDKEFAAYLRSIPRELTPEQVDQNEAAHDLSRGEYIPHTEVTHNGESRH